LAYFAGTFGEGGGFFFFAEDVWGGLGVSVGLETVGTWGRRGTLIREVRYLRFEHS
jgi:hypothetical protein